MALDFWPLKTWCYWALDVLLWAWMLRVAWRRW